MNNVIQPFGYAELYELSNSSQHKYGRFVKFDQNNSSKIIFANDNENLVGVTSTNFSVLSNSYNEWPKKYIYDKFGEVFLEKKTIAKGKLDYDDINEFPYIRTYKEEDYFPVKNDYYNESIEYISRLDRNEWIPVVLIGKCIVEDDGTCIPGKKCNLYNGNNEDLYGTVTISDTGWYVLERVDKNTVMILYK